MRDTRPKMQRNRELIAKRIQDPSKWSWGELGKYFNIHRTTAKDVYVRFRRGTLDGISN